ncbi:MAG: aminoacyl-tRNA hydrolase [Dehalococcoidia bacterium]
MKLIVGLGNPGRVYSDSRHNFGFRCINRFAREHGIEFSKQRSKSRVGFGEVAGEKIVLAKPQTFMNLSGESVGPLVRYYRIDLPDLLVIYDDVDLPLGTIRIREKGGAAGHNGMKSIIQNVGSQDFPRIRVGISPPAQEGGGSNRNPDFVLGKFTREEKRIVDQVCPRVAEAIDHVLGEGIVAAMTKYNAA